MTSLAFKARRLTAGRLSLFLRAFGLMDRREQVSAGLLVALMMVVGFVETTITAMVFPIVYAILEPDKLLTIPGVRPLLAFVGQDSPRDLFPFVVLVAVSLIVLSSLASMALVYFAERHSNRCVARVTRLCVERYVEAPYLWSLKRNPTVMTGQIYSDVIAWRVGFIGAQLTMVQSAILILAPTSVAIFIAPGIAMVAMLVLGLSCLLIVLLFRPFVRRVAERARKLRLNFSKSMFHVVAAVREMKVSGDGDYFINRYDREYRRALQEAVKSKMLGIAPGTLLRLIGQVGVLVIALILVLTGKSGTDLAVLLALLGVVGMRVLPAASRIVDNLVELSRSAPATVGLLRFLDESGHEIESQTATGAAAVLPGKWRTIDLEAVSFTYPDAPKQALADASLQIEFGKCYGFVGRSGSGKSTLLNLLLGLIRPTTGTIWVDGVPLSEADVRDWHPRFGYVPQDPYVFDATVRENVVLGRNASDAEVLDALKRAGLERVIARLPDGIKTRVGERSRQLSGGELQRLVLARALFRRPEILYLDEATSALDSVTEGEVYEAIQALRGHATALVVTHRVSRLRVCDRIFVMHEGRIIDRGTYDELLVRCGSFGQLVREMEDPAAA